MFPDSSGFGYLAPLTTGEYFLHFYLPLAGRRNHTHGLVQPGKNPGHARPCTSDYTDAGSYGEEFSYESGMCFVALPDSRTPEHNRSLRLRRAVP